MTPKIPPIGLPRIPSLPPIQMPDTSNLFGASNGQKRSDSPSSRPSSSSPYAAQDAFLTAHTSLSPDQPSSSSGNGSPVYLYPPVAPAMTTPAGLRKSISVDSFVSYKPGMATARPKPSSPLSSASQADADHAPPSSSRQSDASTPTFRPPWADRDKRATARSRGTSVSTTTDDRDPGVLDESDLERSEDFSRRTRKGKQSSRQSVRPGELPMPSRLQLKGSVPSMQVARAGPPISPSRSSSLNGGSSKQRSLMPVRTHLQEYSPPEITLLVVGPHGCGKSAVIQKGLKHCGLSKPEEIDVPGRKGTFTYTARRGVIPAGQDGADCTLRVLEADVSTFNLSHARGIWADATDVWDGILICYDATEKHSLAHVQDLLYALGELHAPVIVLACKSELEQRVNPTEALAMLKPYDIGLVEASTTTEAGKERIRKAFQWVLKAITRPPDSGESHRNPASPAFLTTSTPPPWDVSRASSATPTAASSHPINHHQQPSPTNRTSNHAPSQSTSQATRAYHQPLNSTASGTTSTPASPTRARSTSDLLSEHEKSKRDEREGHAGVYNVARNSSHNSLHAHPGLGAEGPPSTTDVSTSEGAGNLSVKESRAPPWMSLDDLLNKLLFMAVCDDDPIFISHFLLTYRRFASPRTVLLAMQKRMRSLDHPSGDPMFACYAQMRICQLLDHWINLYPTDFAVSGASGALGALIKSILNKTYLLHYGAEFLPFLEMVSSLRDKDSSWGLKVEDESSDNSSLSDEEHSFLMDNAVSQRSMSPTPIPADNASTGASGSQSGFARERKASLPLTAKALIAVPASSAPFGHLSDPVSGTASGMSAKVILRTLQTTSQALYACDPADIAQEMTRIQCQFFLRIEPRHWLQHVLVQGKKDTEADPITVYNLISNHFGEWVVSLILCHDKPKGRARQIEKFIDVANRLRNLHNYSGLRAIIAGINSATFEGDESLELLRTKASEHWKNFQQWDQLLQSVRSHQKYRMALRNTKGACIPALEIHLSDLIRAHEGNPDHHDDDPTKIHWAKFNMMARFIDTIVQCQKGCRESSEYDRFPDRVEVRRLFLIHQEDMLMDYEMQRSRIALPDLEYEDNLRSVGPRVASRDPNHKDAAIFRKLLNFSWT
ncbi:ras GEF [Polyporus arcularius HHB13444]|uniref:Ras GEF n=1 Tax=Polyporus arcularius HHB13444 TaxID=1314778 RepID=A0A5C3PKA5_9APHY|nr:ras GEF [Polyporus arcularius HHB13444]